MDISGLQQPFDAVTAGDSIVVVMDDHIKSFMWNGNQTNDRRHGGLKPFSIDYNKRDNLFYVTNKATNSVVVYDQSFGVVQEFGHAYLNEPSGLTIAKDKKMLMVLSKKSGTITTFDLYGKYINSIKAGDLKDPWHIKCHRRELIVTDAGSKMIKIFDLNNPSKLLHSIPTRLETTEMHCRGLDVDEEGNIYVGLRAPGFRTQRESIAKYNHSSKALVATFLDNSPKKKGLFRANSRIAAHAESVAQDLFGPDKDVAKLDFSRGIHYIKRKGEPYLLIVDAGNQGVRIKRL